MEESWTIGEVGRRAGLRPSALRYYESAGLLTAPARRHARRYYDSSVFQQLAVIDAAQQAGFTVAEIKVLLHGFGSDVTASARWRALATAKLPEVEALIRRAQAMKHLLEAGLKCGCVRFEECVMVAGQGCAAEPAPAAISEPPEDNAVANERPSERPAP